MTPHQFVQKWSQITLKEITVAQSHFFDVCALIGHATPLEADPQGEFFTFEAAVQKTGGTAGRADVWFKGHFIWEYKGAHADLDKAYQQLLLYRESLGNPPLLITSDTQRILIHTNFTNTVKRVYPIGFDAILSGQGVDLLRRAFTDPESFRPDETQEAVTRASANAFVRVARTLQTWAKAEGREEDPERLAHFLIRLLFALFAEDMKLLPENVFTKLVETHKGHPANFRAALRGLFAAMRDGQMFGFYPIRTFNGGLFEDDFVPDLPGGILHDLAEACAQNWASLEPSIFGTLFERVIDESKRAQLGAHYTSKDDIMLIVEPVLMQPLREEWQRVKREATQILRNVPAELKETPMRDLEAMKLYQRLFQFSGRITQTRVLDPACGSGNFLYVALRQLLDLQKEVITFSALNGLDRIPLTVSPHQLYGIEINPYAHELAQITVWIGYLQWRMENGFAEFADPVLRPLKNIENKDAILTYNAEGKPVEPEWPEVEVVIGNPPFLGGNRIRQGLGDTVVDNLFKLYDGRVPAFADLVCYWFERGRNAIENKSAKRVGLLATQSIRGGVNRKVLERIKETGDIYWAYSDRNWVLDGATVHVSMIGFDGGVQANKILDGRVVSKINSDLTSETDLTTSVVLEENLNISFQGPSPKAPFDFDEDIAKKLLAAKNRSGVSNAIVVRPYASAIDLTQGSRNKWTIDFGLMQYDDASQYEAPFKYVEETIYPIRANSRKDDFRGQWWQFARPRPEMRDALAGKLRYIATPRHAKYRVFVWMDAYVLCSDATIVFATESEYMFGVLHSTAHELWARRKGTQLREAESGARYTPTTCFETFPFPWPPGQEPRQLPTQERRSSGETFALGDRSDERRSLISDPMEGNKPRSFADSTGREGDDWQKVEAIADAARQLDAFRTTWLFPPEREIGVTISASMLNKRTLTNLYNALTDYRATVKGRHRDANAWYNKVSGLIGLDEIETLDHIHNELDRAVLSAYGWPSHLGEEEILGRLLAENLRRATSSGSDV